MSQLQLFTFAEAFPLRIIDIDGKPWFIAADVCKALGLDNTTKALIRLDADEQALKTIQGISRGNDEVNVINESGLYSLILTSNKPQAKQFKKWVTSEVLPTIHKTGSYSLAPKTYVEALRALADETERAERLTQQAALDAPKVEFAEAVMTQAEEKGLQAVARHFNLPPNKFINWLAEHGLIFKRQQFGSQTPVWEPRAFMSVGGYITLRQEMCHDGRTRPQPKVSGKGLEYISRLLEQKGFP